jgi:thiol:disulfide interchange protein DsbC
MEVKVSPSLKLKACKTPVKEIVILSEELGFMGTPVILSEGGQHLGGYLSPDDLIKKLDVEKAGT